MEFKEFLEKRPKYMELYLLEIKGSKEEIERVSKQHGNKTKAIAYLFNTETYFMSKHPIYVSNRGYAILWGRRKILLEKFK